MPVFRLAVDVLQHNKLRQRQQWDSGQHRNTDPFDAHFPPLFQRVAQEQHVGEIAGDDEKDLHPEGMDEVIKQRQPPRGLSAVDMPAVAGINQRNVERDPQQHQPGADAVEEIFTLYRSIIHTIHDNLR